jgi:hypothetical protein
MARLVAFAASIAILAACSHSSPGQTTIDSDVPPDDSPFVPDACKSSLDQPTNVFVGQGQTFYSDLTDNQVLTWEKGPQGGHHVWIALRMTGVRQTQTITTVDMDDIDLSPTVNLNHSRVVYDFNRDEGGYCTLSGLRMQLDLAGDPPLASIIGHHIRVTATLQDPDHAVATGTKVIIVTGDPT